MAPRGVRCGAGCGVLRGGSADSLCLLCSVTALELSGCSQQGLGVMQGLQAMLRARTSRRSLLTLSGCLSPPSLGKKKWFWLMQTWFGASVRSSLLLLGICQVLRCLCAAGLPAGCPSTAPRSCTATGPSGGPHIPLGHSPSSSCPANMLWAARGCARGS